MIALRLHFRKQQLKFLFSFRTQELTGTTHFLLPFLVTPPAFLKVHGRYSAPVTPRATQNTAMAEPQQANKRPPAETDGSN